MSPTRDIIPFNRPYQVGTETGYIEEALARGQISADGSFTRLCRGWLEERLGAEAVLLTTSCTSALEAAALLVGLGPGDEVIMPSFTFVTTATSVALRGAVPVFVDVEPVTLNLDPALIEAAITPATKAVIPVHYAGVGCDMAAIQRIAHEHGLAVIEDAAQGLMADVGGQPLGTLGDLGAISFHETKNVTCGEGGALVVNRAELVERAEIVREKGTNRIKFEQGRVDKYTWVDLGSSYALSDLNAAFLWGQLQAADEITAKRLAIWESYHSAFAVLEADGLLRRPVVPAGRTHNAHMYQLITRDSGERTKMLALLAEAGVHAVFHYVPLHSAPAGLRYARAHSPLPVTDDLSARLLRLPLWAGMDGEAVDRVVAAVSDATASLDSRRRAPMRA